MKTYCFRDTVLSRRGNIGDGPLKLVLADIRDSFQDHKGIVTLTFAQKRQETEDSEDGRMKRPISILQSMISALRETYRGLPIMLWSICPLCGKRMIRWDDTIPPSSDTNIPCDSCSQFSKPPNLSQWPRLD